MFFKLQDIYNWCGSECNHFERVKALRVAIDIRDNERKGRAKMHLIDEGSEPEDFLNVSQPFRSAELNNWCLESCQDVGELVPSENPDWAVFKGH